MFHSISKSSLILALGVAAIALGTSADARAQGPVLGISIDDVVIDRQLGTVEVTVTATCEEAGIVNVSTGVIQSVGRKTSVQGFAGADLECTPGPGVTTTFLIVPFGKFAGSSAIVSASVFGCSVECTSEAVTEVVRLRKE